MKQETLSALLDGECSEKDLDRVLGEFDRSPALKSEFSRMLIARESRSVRIRSHDDGFADRVLAELDRPESGSQTVVPFVQRVSGAWRPVVGLAMAAGLGALAVLALRPATEPGVAPAVAVATAPKPVTVATTANPSERRWSQLAPADAERLNAYLIAYSQSRAQQGMGGTLGHARYAAYTNEQRPQRIEGPRAVTTESRKPTRR